jgi:competence protein ComEC
MRSMSAFWQHQFRRTTLQLWGFGAVICGLGFAYSGNAINPVWLTVPVALLLIRRSKTALNLVLVIVLAFGLGLWRGMIFHGRLGVYQALYDQKITLTVQANEDANYNKYKQMSFSASNLTFDNGTPLPGKLLVSGYGANSILQGDILEVTGKLREGYGTYTGQLGFAQITVIEHHPSLVPDIRRKFVNGMQNALPEPIASFAMGLLVGQRATLPDEVKQDLLMVGLTHIIAVSGYNLTIILRASGGLFAKQSKRLTTYFSIGLIMVLLLVTGSSASIVRAAIVSMLSIWAGHYGRKFKQLNLIILAAAVTAWANPMYVWADISWYLSFLAFYGVLILAPLLATRINYRLHNSLLAMVALESICAEAMTLPYILHEFGQLSLIGLPANVLVVVLIPIAMLLSLIAGLAGMFLVPVAGWVALPAKVLLTYMLDIAHLLSRLPHVFIDNLSLSLMQMIGLYSLIVATTVLLWYKSKSKSDIITDKNDDTLQGAKA